VFGTLRWTFRTFATAIAALVSLTSLQQVALTSDTCATAAKQESWLSFYRLEWVMVVANSRASVQAMPRTIVAILTTLVLALSAAPVRSFEPATADDTARFLAGLSPSSNSPFAALTKDPAWQSHARYFDSIFAREESAHLSKVREFSKRYLTDKHDTMLYMFSGPDFLYATSFFPNASTYVLAGLEPVGAVPDLTSLSPLVMGGELRNLEISTGSLFNYSFFITQNMKTQLRNGPVYGTLPVLYVFLARTGKTIHEVELVSLDEHGDFQTADDATATNIIANKPAGARQRTAAPGAKIVFSEGDGPKQTLYYFSTNLVDGSFERSGFSAFLAKLGPADSLIKSASYLLHKAHFASVRNLLLNNSATILQDDSGIPLTYFEATKWRLQAFGHYAGPISLFTNFYQPRMAELFQSASPLDFGIGYQWRNNESNLLLAQRSSLLNGNELTAQAQPDASAVAIAASSSKKTRKRVESGGTPSLNCRIARVFPFCW
jgi:hypothetical protein